MKEGQDAARKVEKVSVADWCFVVRCAAPGSGRAERGADGRAGVPAAVTANVVALDQVFFYNRLGAVNPGGMIYALRRDVVDVATGKTEAQGGVLSPGRVALRADKRPRPLVLRMNVRDCLTISFQNLLNPARVNDNQPVTRSAGLHVTGLQLVTSIADDGSNVGANASSLAAPGQRRTYKLFAERENTYLFYSPAAQTGGKATAVRLLSGSLAR